MGRSSISFGLCEYLLSVVPISPYPLWKISASLKEGISITYGRHLFDLVPLPFTKVPHSGATFQVWQGFHISNIYNEGELEYVATVKDYLTVQKEGKRIVKRHVNLYNLDVIISVGYRVKSLCGTKFRQWANQVLKDYLLKGYVVNQRISVLEHQVADLTEKVIFFVRSSLPPVEGIFFDGQIFDAYVQIVNLIKQAKRSITLIDNYIDETTLTMLSKRDANVSATIYTRQLSNQQQLDVQRHNQQYPPIIVNICQRNHDRFLIIDDMVYLFGASLKDACKFSFNSPNCLYTKKS